MAIDLDHHLQFENRNHYMLAHQVLSYLFRDYLGSFVIQLWNDSKLLIGDDLSAFTLKIKDASVLRDLILFRDPIKLAEAYFDGYIEVEGDFSAALGLRNYLESLKLPFRTKLHLALKVLFLNNNKSVNHHKSALPKTFAKDGGAPRHNGKETIAFHYDISNDFYQLWLDERMLYSCAYFEHPQQNLEQAQCNKLDHICRKLRLQPGEQFLDIGCGWGALACWAAKHYGVQAHGITLSQSQYEYACNEVRNQHLQGQVSITLCDYRDLPMSICYDKISSIGMFEHVGLKKLPAYFSIVNRLLKPNGLFLNHGITTAESGWGHCVSSRFINRHVFPDGELETVSAIQALMENENFEISDVEGLRPHYALTLRHWVHRLEQNYEAAVTLVGERNYRIWRLYMTGCALQFEQGQTGIYQILAVRKNNSFSPLPLTRRDLYQEQNNYLSLH
jgi:cyclopropane-fatty-acyl-phospholipid synthase